MPKIWKSCCACLLALSFSAAAHNWSYSGDTGPNHWGELAPEFEQCMLGTHQSPVDLVNPQLLPPNLLNVKYQKLTANLLLNEYSLYESIHESQENFIEVNRKDYELDGFHFHMPSEHQLNGKNYPMEVHFVHHDKGQLVVLGVFVEEGDENPLLQQIIDLPLIHDNHEKSFSHVLFDPRQLLPDNFSHFQYEGSLTTPPCTESVRWVILKKPITASREQIAYFKQNLIAYNARPIQPLNDRQLS